MDLGWSLLIGLLVIASLGVLRNIIENITSGLWLRISKEIVVGDELTVKSDFKEKTGEVEDMKLRNIVLRLGNGEELLVQTSKVFDDDVIRRRD